MDERDHVWISDFGCKALWRFEPGRENLSAWPREAASVSRARFWTITAGYLERWSLARHYSFPCDRLRESGMRPGNTIATEQPYK